MKQAVRRVAALSDPLMDPNVRAMSGEWAGCMRLRVGTSTILGYGRRSSAIRRRVFQKFSAVPMKKPSGCASHRPSQV